MTQARRNPAAKSSVEREAAGASREGLGPTVHDSRRARKRGINPSDTASSRMLAGSGTAAGITILSVKLSAAGPFPHVQTQTPAKPGAPRDCSAEYETASSDAALSEPQRGRLVPCPRSRDGLGLRPARSE